ncbi:ABC transporter ATP-binding protein [Hyphomonas chukchiensis]|mgnify:FL=1|uniref:ABC transporter ATP-binding protein n=1 Tax=Hyphomonas chukchiensis TaxID=1280947 RepID=UPI0030FA5489
MNIFDPTKLDAKRISPPDDVSLAAHKISVTFRTRAAISQSADAEADQRFIWNKSGRLIGVRALHDISFELQRGDRLAIVGKNGSGKTTLLQVLAGIITPEVGKIVSIGKVTSLININLGIQIEATGHRNITLRGLAAGYSKKDIELRRREIAEFSELGDFLDMPMESYSAGMRMRLTFAIATAFEPEILILDEWLSAGDASFKEKATTRMQDFVGQAGILVLASHSRKLLLDNCEKGMWLDEGRIRAFGDVETILNEYEAQQKSGSR